MKDILDPKSYDNYKATMALYLTPNNLCNRGRFCCAYCEMIFTDQWSLEKVCDVRCIDDPTNEFCAFFQHLHSSEHEQKKSSDDHKDLVVVCS